LASGRAEGVRSSDNLTRGIHRLTWMLLILGSVGVLLSSVYRAATVPFTIDESLSFASFTWDPSWRVKANNHLLNTALMHGSSILLGNSEISLRLPNLLAHGAYLLCALALIKRFRHPVLQLTGFAVLNLNLFLLDFFSLARGYGLALGFQLLSLYLLVRGYEEKPHGDWVKYLASSLAAALLSVLSNFSFLNYYLPLLLVCVWLLLSDISFRRFSRSHVALTLGVGFANAAVLAFILLKIVRLRHIGQLYIGGQVSFMSDTVESLVRCSLYSNSYSQAATKLIAIILTVSFFLLLLLGLRELFVLHKNSVSGVLLFILASATALPILQHRLLHTVYPIERAALYYIPLYGLVLLLALHSLVRSSSHGWQRTVGVTLSVAIAVTLGWHFYRGFNPGASYTWAHDSHNSEVLAIIKRDHEQNSPGRAVNLRTSGLMIPSLTFYRITRHYTWLLPMNRAPITRSKTDYIYAFQSELDSLPIDRDTRLASYPDIQTVLLRVNHLDPP
jgi:hypothetical protein